MPSLFHRKWLDGRPPTYLSDHRGSRLGSWRWLIADRACADRRPISSLLADLFWHVLAIAAFDEGFSTAVALFSPSSFYS